jgi:hypothetical protein
MRADVPLDTSVHAANNKWGFDPVCSIFGWLELDCGGSKRRSTITYGRVSRFMGLGRPVIIARPGARRVAVFKYDSGSMLVTEFGNQTTDNCSGPPRSMQLKQRFRSRASHLS